MCGSGKCCCGSKRHCHCRERCGCGCGGGRGGGDCGCEGRFQRRYPTKAEQVADLQEYLKDLKAEVKAVEEMLKDLRRKG